MDSVSYTPLTPLSFLPRSARVFPGKTAVIYGRRRLTYADSRPKPHGWRGRCGQPASDRATGWLT